MVFFRFIQWHVVQRYQLGDVILISYAGINVKNGGVGGGEGGSGFYGHKMQHLNTPFVPSGYFITF